MGPSTFPSICKSSVPVMCPLICRLDPRRAELRAGLLIGAGEDGLLKATTAGFAACADGDSVWACCFVHIVCSLCGCRLDSSSGWEEQRGLNLGREWTRSNGELKEVCVARKLATRTGLHETLRYAKPAASHKVEEMQDRLRACPSV